MQVNAMKARGWKRDNQLRLGLVQFRPKQAVLRGLPKKGGFVIEGDQYIVRLNEEDVPLRQQLEALRATISRLRDAIKTGDFTGIDLASLGPRFKPMFVAQHLYHPLIYASDVEVQPVALNDGERQFVEDLRDYYQSEKNHLFAGKELYLLPLLSKLTENSAWQSRKYSA